MGIRRKKISDSQKNKIKELLDTQTPKEIHESCKGTRSQISLSEIYKIRREKLESSKTGTSPLIRQATESQRVQGPQRFLIGQDLISTWLANSSASYHRLMPRTTLYGYCQMLHGCHLRRRGLGSFHRCWIYTRTVAS
jgi:hypothetical protein